MAKRGKPSGKPEKGPAKGAPPGGRSNSAGKRVAQPGATFAELSGRRPSEDTLRRTRRR